MTLAPSEAKIICEAIRAEGTVHRVVENLFLISKGLSGLKPLLVFYKIPATMPVSENESDSKSYMESKLGNFPLTPLFGKK